MSNDKNHELCREIEENIANVINGDVEPHLLEHIAGCDRCRDLRYDAIQVAEVVQDAGGDYQHPADFEQALMAKVDSVGASGPQQPPAADPAPVRATTVKTSVVVAVGGDVSGAEEGRSTQPLPSAPTGDEGRSTQPLPTPAAEAPAKPAAAVAEAPAKPAPTVAEAPVRPAPTVAEAPVKPAPTVAEAPAKPAPTVAESKPVPAKIAPVAEHFGQRVGKTVSQKKGKVIALGAGGLVALAAAAGMAIWVGTRDGTPSPEEPSGEAWTAQIASVKYAGKDNKGGLQRCAPDGSACAEVTDGSAVTAGSMLRTDPRTRVHLKLSDGSMLALDRATELTLVDGKTRVAKVNQGLVVASIAHLDNAPGAKFELPVGTVDVLGTKLSMTVTEDRSTVEVMRGAVRVTDKGGDSAVVRAGEEGTLAKEGGPVVQPASALAESVIWSEQGEVEGPEEVVVRGLGELRAKKPGKGKEMNQAVRLTKHDVKVRIVDSIARTEIDETFTNDTGDVLEGIYRFPLPPDAQIERLALEVDGKLEEGAFVDKERAAAIWRGVIAAAAPKAPKPREEIIWVPGPWRDPALLEWQRGGRFELRIYPIPANGSRRVVLSYTQSVPRSGGVRRYTYPLSYDKGGSTRVADFNVDAQVRGHDKGFGVRSRGYDMKEDKGLDADAARMKMNAKSFVPSGDITLEYSLPSDKSEVTAWAYLPQPKAADDDDDDKKKKPAAAKPPAEVITADTSSAYVALALRPKLPRWSEGKFRDQVIVVDASRSMVGERLKRAASLAESVVREMDRRDRFGLLVCDITCRPMDQALKAPGGAASQRVKEFLAKVEPEGGTDLVEAVREARNLVDKSGDKRELRIIYIGDGTPSVGPVRPAHLRHAVAKALPAGTGALTAVAVGADADAHALAALARGGGGVMIPFVPGEKATRVAYRVLGASYGIALRNPVVELPDGLTEVYPKLVDNISAGGETIVVARMNRPEISGSVKLKGSVGGDAYEQTYPVKLAATKARGNAFVPRLFAATKITDLEVNQGENAKKELVELSKQFAVASRYTSLLVLESPAMFKAFGIDRTAGTMPSWTGEEKTESSAADGLVRYAEDADDELDGAGFGMGGSARASSGSKRDAAKPKSAPRVKAPRPTATTAAPLDMAGGPAAAEQERSRRPTRRPRGGMVPMKRVWDRKGTVSTEVGAAKRRAQKKLGEAEREVSANPNNRTKLEKLLGLYAITGQVDRAGELAKKWAEKEALDPGALIARAEVAARQGERAKAIRILGGLADVRPGDATTQNWLASLYQAMGKRERSCSHRIALAGMRATDVSAVSNAVRCSRNIGLSGLGDVLLSDVAEEKIRLAIDRELGKTAPDITKLRGDVRVEATWDADVDLDIAIIGKNGERYSWLGDPKGRVTARDATARRAEAIAVFNAPQGHYVIEVTRADGSDANIPVRGELKVRASGSRRTIPFVLSGKRSEVGSLKIYYTSRLVPVSRW